MICKQALQLFTLKPHFSIGHFERSGSEANIGGRTAQGPSMMEIPNRQPRPPRPSPQPEPSSGPPRGCTQALWESFFSVADVASLMSLSSFRDCVGRQLPRGHLRVRGGGELCIRECGCKQDGAVCAHA